MKTRKHTHNKQKRFFLIALATVVCSIPSFIYNQAQGQGLGIDIDPPISRLHLYENTVTTGLTGGFTIEQAGAGDAIAQFLLTGGQRWVAGLDNSDGDKFKIASSADLNTNAIFTLQTTGQAGFGITTPISSLHLYENTASGNATVGLTIEQNGTGDALTQYLLTGGQRWVMGIDNDDGDRFKIASSLGLGSDERIIIETTGNIGIGNSNPQEILHLGGALILGPNSNIVNGTIRYTGTDFEGMFGGSWYSFTAGAAGVDGDYDNGGEDAGANRTLGNNDAYDLGIETDNTTRMTIASTGEVGIGTTSPTEVLHLFDDGGDVTVRYQAQTAGTGQLNTGNRSPTAGSNSGAGVAWSNPTFVLTSNDAYATVTNGISRYLAAYNYGFAVPGGATIDGIEVAIEKSKTSNPVTALDAWTARGFTNSSSSNNFNYTVSAGADRLLVAYAWQANNNGSRALSSVTFNGQAFTNVEVEQVNDGDDMTLEVWYLDEAGIAAAGAGPLNLVFTWDGTINDSRTYAVGSYKYVNQVTPISSSTDNSTTSSTASLLLGAALNVIDGDYMIVAGGIKTATNQPAAPAGYTEQADQSASGGPDATLAVNDKAIVANGIEQPTITFSGSESFAIAGIVLNQNDNQVYDNSVRIVQTGVILGTEMANPSEWSTSETYTSYGSATELWGVGWTPAQINATNFGVAIKVGAGSNAIANIDYVRINVYYTVAPPAYTEWSTGVDASDGGKFKISKTAAVGGSDVMTFTTAGGVIVGAPTGGDKGAGTINAVAVYDDNVLLTDHVFDNYFDGKIREEDQALHKDYKMMTIDDMVTFMEKNRHLPTISGRKEWKEKGKFSTGQLITQFWETIEVQALYIKELKEKIDAIETQMEELKKNSK